MNKLPVVTNVPPIHAPLPRKSLLSAAFFLCVVSSFCIAQENRLIAPPSLLKPGQALNQPAKQTGSANDLIVGSWGFSRNSEDKELAEIETSVVNFMRDGTYTTSLRSSVFPDQGKQPLASGRYKVAEAEKGGLLLMLERAPGDPDADKSTAQSKMSFTVVDPNTLRAEDGSVITRLK